MLLWMECIAAGVANMARMARARIAWRTGPPKALMIPFFALHYSAAMVAVGVFLCVAMPMPGASSVWALLATTLAPGLLATLALLAIEHGRRAWSDRSGDVRARKGDLATMMIRPYARLIPLLGVVVASAVCEQAALRAVLLAGIVAAKGVGEMWVGLHWQLSPAVVRRTALGAGAALLLAACGAGACFVWVQHVRLACFTPVPAIVTEAHVASETETWTDEDGRPCFSVTYTAAVAYAYEVGGRWFEGGRVLPFALPAVYLWSSSRENARAVMERVVGPMPDEVSRVEGPMGTVAYCNPRDPTDAFVAPVGSSLPFLCFLVPWALGLLVCAARLAPESRGRRRVAVAWHVTGLLIILYATVYRAFFGADLAITLAVYEALGLIPLRLALSEDGVQGRLRMAMGDTAGSMLIMLILSGPVVAVVAWAGLLVSMVSSWLGKPFGGPHWALYVAATLAVIAVVTATVMGVFTFRVGKRNARWPDETSKPFLISTGLTLLAVAPLLVMTALGFFSRAPTYHHNLASGATAFAVNEMEGGAARPAFPAASAIDGDAATCWDPGAGAAQGAWISLCWPAAVAIHRIEIHPARGCLAAFTVQRLDEVTGAWVDLVRVDVDGRSSSYSHTGRAPWIAANVRIDGQPLAPSAGAKAATAPGTVAKPGCYTIALPRRVPAVTRGLRLQVTRVSGPTLALAELGVY